MDSEFLEFATITSDSNPRVKAARALLRRKGREKAGQCLIEGYRFVQDAVLAGARLSSIFFTQQFAENPHWWALLDLIRGSGASIDWIMVPDTLLSRLSETETPQGIVAVAQIPRWDMKQALTGTEPFLLVADRIQDPGNLGTMVRSAAAAGCTGVILTKGTVDAFSGKVLRSTMGAVFRIPVIPDVSASNLVETLTQSRCRLVVGEGSAEMTYHEADLSAPVAVVVGNEGAGPAPEIVSAAEALVRIPLENGVESLNAAVAAAVLLFEAAKQIKQKRRN